MEQMTVMEKMCNGADDCDGEDVHNGVDVCATNGIKTNKRK